MVERKHSQFGMSCCSAQDVVVVRNGAVAVAVVLRSLYHPYQDLCHRRMDDDGGDVLIHTIPFFLCGLSLYETSLVVVVAVEDAFLNGWL